MGEEAVPPPPLVIRYRPFVSTYHQRVTPTATAPSPPLLVPSVLPIAVRPALEVDFKFKISINI